MLIQVLFRTSSLANNTCILNNNRGYVVQWQRILLPMQETWVLSLGWEDLLEEEVATSPSTLAWEIPWTEESAGPQSKGLQRAGSELAIKQQQNKCWHTYTVKYYGDIKITGFEEFIKEK